MGGGGGGTHGSLPHTQPPHPTTPYLAGFCHSSCYFFTAASLPRSTPRPCRDGTVAEYRRSSGLGEPPAPGRAGQDSLALCFPPQFFEFSNRLASHISPLLSPGTPKSWSMSVNPHAWLGWGKREMQRDTPAGSYLAGKGILGGDVVPAWEKKGRAGIRGVRSQQRGVIPCSRVGLVDTFPSIVLTAHPPSPASSSRGERGRCRRQAGWGLRYRARDSSSLPKG